MPGRTERRRRGLHHTTQECHNAVEPVSRAAEPDRVHKKRSRIWTAALASSAAQVSSPTLAAPNMVWTRRPHLPMQWRGNPLRRTRSDLGAGMLRVNRGDHTWTCNEVQHNVVAPRSCQADSDELCGSPAEWPTKRCKGSEGRPYPRMKRAYKALAYESGTSEGEQSDPKKYRTRGKDKIKLRRRGAIDQVHLAT